MGADNVAAENEARVSVNQDFNKSVRLIHGKSFAIGPHKGFPGLEIQSWFTTLFLSHAHHRAFGYREHGTRNHTEVDIRAPERDKSLRLGCMGEHTAAVDVTDCIQAFRSGNFHGIIDHDSSTVPLLDYLVKSIRHNRPTADSHHDGCRADWLGFPFAFVGHSPFRRVNSCHAGTRDNVDATTFQRHAQPLGNLAVKRRQNLLAILDYRNFCAESREYRCKLNPDNAATYYYKWLGGEISPWQQPVARNGIFRSGNIERGRARACRDNHLGSSIGLAVYLDGRLVDKPRLARHDVDPFEQHRYPFAQLSDNLVLAGNHPLHTHRRGDRLGSDTELRGIGKGQRGIGWPAETFGRDTSAVKTSPPKFSTLDKSDRQPLPEGLDGCIVAAGARSYY